MQRPVIMPTSSRLMPAARVATMAALAPRSMAAVPAAAALTGHMVRVCKTHGQARYSEILCLTILLHI